MPTLQGSWKRRRRQISPSVTKSPSSQLVQLSSLATLSHMERSPPILSDSSLSGICLSQQMRLLYACSPTMPSGYTASLRRFTRWSKWRSPTAVAAFNQLKKDIENAVLNSVSESVQFLVETDASDFAIAATLN